MIIKIKIKVSIYPAAVCHVEVGKCKGIDGIPY